MEYLIHGDIETGGLNGRLENDRLGMDYYPIFEIAIVVTDLNLKQIGEPLLVTIFQDEDMIARSDMWALDNHDKSGLLEKVRRSTITLKDAEKLIIEHLKALGIESYDRDKRTGGVFSGNSIMFDRSFFMCQMPTLHEYWHYRQLDISAIALAARAFKPAIEKKATAHKRHKHEALADIQDSIEELRYYRDVFTSFSV